MCVTIAPWLRLYPDHTPRHAKRAAAMSAGVLPVLLLPLGNHENPRCLGIQRQSYVATDRSAAIYYLLERGGQVILGCLSVESRPTRVTDFCAVKWNMFLYWLRRVNCMTTMVLRPLVLACFSLFCCFMESHSILSSSCGLKRLGFSASNAFLVYYVFSSDVLLLWQLNIIHKCNLGSKLEELYIGCEPVRMFPIAHHYKEALYTCTVIWNFAQEPYTWVVWSRFDRFSFSIRNGLKHKGKVKFNSFIRVVQLKSTTYLQFRCIVPFFVVPGKLKRKAITGLLNIFGIPNKIEIGELCVSTIRCYNASKRPKVLLQKNYRCILKGKLFKVSQTAMPA